MVSFHGFSEAQEEKVSSISLIETINQNWTYPQAENRSYSPCLLAPLITFILISSEQIQLLVGVQHEPAVKLFFPCVLVAVEDVQ